jgi:hypothetical protein
VEVQRETGKGKYRFEIWGRYADERWSQAILGFFTTTDVRRRIPGMAEEDIQREASEWERKEWEVRGEEEADERLQFPTYSFPLPQKRSRRGIRSECFPLPFPLPFPRFISLVPVLSSGHARAESGRSYDEARTDRPRSELGRWTGTGACILP